jgi:type VI secretion system secreted protein Hcp
MLALFAGAGALMLAAGAAVAAQVDYFLQLEGVHGESAERPGAIEISSFSWGASRGVGAPTGGAADRAHGAPSVSEIHVTKLVDAASPDLMHASVSGRHFHTAVLYMRKAGGDPRSAEPYLTYRLTDVIISSYQTSGHGSDRPTESLTLNFARIEMEATGPDRSTTLTPAGQATWGTAPALTPH